MQCSNNLKQVALSMFNYESTYKRFPARAYGTTSTAGTATTANTGAFPTNRNHNSGYISGFIALLEFIEQSNMFQQVQAGDANNSRGGPRGDQGWVWGTAPAAYRCPSDPGVQRGVRFISLALCGGDGPGSANEGLDSNNAKRGVFTGRYFWRSISDLSDGTSNTIGIG